jgi:hypothetical protein
MLSIVSSRIGFHLKIKYSLLQSVICILQQTKGSFHAVLKHMFHFL